MANTKVTGDLIASGTITAANLVSGTLDGLLNTYLTTNSYATESYVTTAVSNLIDAAPASLDTLNELAAALNDDANFATTVTDSIATKLPLAGGNITGNLSVDTDVLFVDTANDRVGIGTSSPDAQLHLVKDAPEIRLTDTTFGTYYSIGGANVGLTFSYNGSEVMRIRDGNVGIGTSSPSATLEINSTVSNAAKLRVGRSTTNTNALELGTIGGDSTITAIGISTVYGATVFNRSKISSVVESMRIDSSGNVGIGTTSPTEKLTVNGNINFPFSTSGNARIGIETSPTNPFATTAKELIIQGANAYLAGSPTQAQAGGDVFIKGGYSIINTGLGVYAGDVSIEGGETYTGGTNGAGNVIFKTAGLERVRITSNGDVCIGTTSATGILNLQNAAPVLYANATNGVSGLRINVTGGNTQLLRLQNAGSTKLSVFPNGNYDFAGSDVSDIALKENITEIASGLLIIDALVPKTYNMIGRDDIRKGGFIAQEVEAVLPEAVHGEDGQKGLDYNSILAHSVKAIQELKEIVDQQQIEIDNLKAQLNG